VPLESFQKLAVKAKLGYEANPTHVHCMAADAAFWTELMKKFSDFKNQHQGGNPQ
jgi:hypothetical protein